MIGLPLALAVIFAAHPDKDDDPLWTKDGRYVVRVEVPELDAAFFEEIPPPAAIVTDLRTGEEQRFEIAKYDPKKKPEVQSKALAAWIKAHPAVRVKASRASPDKKAKAEVALSEETTSGTWQNGHWVAGGRTTWSLSIVRDGKTTPSARCGGGSSITAHWSPDKRRVLWSVWHQWTGARDSGYSDWIVGPSSGPTISLSLEPGQRKNAAGLADALEKAGFVLTDPLTAKSPPAKTVVKAKDGFEDAAQKIAGLIGGGAAVEKAPASAERDITISLGK